MERLDHPARRCFYVHLECAPALPRGAVSWQARSSFVCRDSSLPSSQAHIWSSMSSAAACASEKAESKNSRGCIREPKSRADLLRSRWKARDTLGKGQEQLLAHSLCENLLSLEGMNHDVLNVVHWRWDMRGLSRGKFRFDKTSCGQVRPAYWDKCRGGFRKWDIVPTRFLPSANASSFFYSLPLGNSSRPRDISSFSPTVMPNRMRSPR